jgi:hypothetical protein
MRRLAAGRPSAWWSWRCGWWSVLGASSWARRWPIARWWSAMRWWTSAPGRWSWARTSSAPASGSDGGRDGARPGRPGHTCPSSAPGPAGGRRPCRLASRRRSPGPPARAGRQRAGQRRVRGSAGSVPEDLAASRHGSAWASACGLGDADGGGLAGAYDLRRKARLGGLAPYAEWCRMGGLGAEVRDTLKPSQGSQTGKEIPVSAISTAQPPATVPTPRRTRPQMV